MVLSTCRSWLTTVSEIRPPALHFFAKRRAADRDSKPVSSSTPAKRTSLSLRGPTRLSTTSGVSEGPADGVGGGSDDHADGRTAPAWDKGEDEDREGGDGESTREELDQVVYYYDVATFWVRPVDIKVRVRGSCCEGKLVERCEYDKGSHGLDWLKEPCLDDAYDLRIRTCSCHLRVSSKI